MRNETNVTQTAGADVSGTETKKERMKQFMPGEQELIGYMAGGCASMDMVYGRFMVDADKEGKTINRAHLKAAVMDLFMTGKVQFRQMSDYTQLPTKTTRDHVLFNGKVLTIGKVFVEGFEAGDTFDVSADAAAGTITLTKRAA